MNTRAAYTAAEAPGTPGSQGVGDHSLDRIPRKVVNDAIAVLLDLGYQTTRNQALRLLREWGEWREADTRRFIAAEFGEFVQRRGDVMQLRSKKRMDWRTRT